MSRLDLFVLCERFTNGSDLSVTLKKRFLRILPDKIQNTVRKLLNDERICRETVDYMSRMALEKDDFRRLSVIWEFRVTGNWVAARVASRKWPFTVKTIFTVPRSCPNIVKPPLKS